MDLAAIRRAAFERTLQRIGLCDQELGEELHAHYMDERRRACTPYTDVRATLQQLRGGYTIALLSNGNTDPSYAGVEDLIDVVQFAHEVGVAKPDPRSYTELERRCGESRRRIVMVGDDLADDVIGAQQAGWRGIWLNRDGGELVDGACPDAELSTLADLPEVLDALVR